MNDKDTVYLVDASVYVFRAWFSVPDSLTGPDGRPVNAVYGFAGFLHELLTKVQPIELGVAFDESLSTSYRNEIYPAYKANRDPAPPELEYQFALCRSFSEALGLACFASPRFEADDIIGALARKAQARGQRTVIVTRDKDLAQLLCPGDEMWDFAGKQRTGYDDVPGKFGVNAEQIADFLALAGDSVDNIPGVPGIGKKTAAALLEHFPDLDAIYADLERVAGLAIRGAGSIAKKLSVHREAAYLARRLTVIDEEVPLPGSHSRLVRKRPDMQALEVLFERAGFGAGQRRQAARLAEQFDRAQSQDNGRLFP